MRELPKSNDEQEHREWLANANIEQVAKYRQHYSSFPTFRSMGSARWEELQLDLKNRTAWHESFMGKVIIGLIIGIILIFVGILIKNYIISKRQQQKVHQQQQLQESPNQTKQIGTSQ